MSTAMLSTVAALICGSALLYLVVARTLRRRSDKE